MLQVNFKLRKKSTVLNYTSHSSTLQVKVSFSIFLSFVFKLQIILSCVAKQLGVCSVYDTQSTQIS